MATEEHDVVLSALVMFERHTRLRRYGGMLKEWHAALAALSEYRRREEAAKPRQMTLEEAMHDTR